MRPNVTVAVVSEGSDIRKRRAAARKFLSVGGCAIVLVTKTPNGKEIAEILGKDPLYEKKIAALLDQPAKRSRGIFCFSTSDRAACYLLAQLQNRGCCSEVLVH